MWLAPLSDPVIPWLLGRRRRSRARGRPRRRGRKDLAEELAPAVSAVVDDGASRPGGRRQRHALSWLILNPRRARPSSTATIARRSRTCRPLCRRPTRTEREASMGRRIRTADFASIGRRSQRRDRLDATADPQRLDSSASSTHAVATPAGPRAPRPSAHPSDLRTRRNRTCRSRPRRPCSLFCVLAPSTPIAKEGGRDGRRGPVTTHTHASLDSGGSYCLLSSCTRLRFCREMPAG